MSRCTVCNSPERSRIESSIELGWSLRSVGERFGVSPSALSRHRRSHHTEIAEAEREIARLKAQQEKQEHMVAVWRVFSRAGWSTPDEIGHRVGRITAALVAQEDYETLSGLMRATGCSESAIWQTVETAAQGNGEDPGRVWEELFAPELEEV